MISSTWSAIVILSEVAVRVAKLPRSRRTPTAAQIQQFFGFFRRTKPKGPRAFPQVGVLRLHKPIRKRIGLFRSG